MPYTNTTNAHQPEFSASAFRGAMGPGYQAAVFTRSAEQSLALGGLRARGTHQRGQRTTPTLSAATRQRRSIKDRLDRRSSGLQLPTRGSLAPNCC